MHERGVAMMFIIFLLAALMGAMLLGAALVVWLWEALLSLPAALFIVGVAYLVLMFVVYTLSVRGHFVRWQHSLEVFYRISDACDAAYRKVKALIKHFM